MCPACYATTIWLVAAATSATGVTAVAACKFTPLSKLIAKNKPQTKQ